MDLQSYNCYTATKILELAWAARLKLRRYTREREVAITTQPSC